MCHIDDTIISPVVKRGTLRTINYSFEQEKPVAKMVREKTPGLGFRNFVSVSLMILRLGFRLTLIFIQT